MQHEYKSLVWLIDMGEATRIQKPERHIQDFTSVHKYQNTFKDLTWADDFKQIISSEFQNASPNLKKH